MKTTLRAISAVLALAASAPALAQQHSQTQTTQATPKVGLGVGLTTASTGGNGSPDFGTLFFVPINVAPNIRIEPFIGWARADMDAVPLGGTSPFNPPQGESSDFTLGIGGFYVAPVAPQMQLYLGGRLASQWQSFRTNAGDKWDRRNTMLAFAAGAEYMPIPRVAFGGELQLGLIWYGDYDVNVGGLAASGGSGNGSATQATVFARFYLF